MKFMEVARNSIAFFAITGGLALLASCSDNLSTTPHQRAMSPQYALSALTTQTYALSSVTPPIQCVDASGAVTTVTGGNVVLSSNGKFTATFTTSTTSGTVVTTQSYAEKGTFVQTGNTIVFKAAGAGTYTATIDNGTLTIADYPYCGATHTAVFTQA